VSGISTAITCAPVFACSQFFVALMHVPAQKNTH
jgi:hypothetical protein